MNWHKDVKLQTIIIKEMWLISITEQKIRKKVIYTNIYINLIFLRYYR